MKNKKLRILTFLILTLAILLSGYSVLAGSDFYESTYNNSHFICRSKCEVAYGEGKIEYADSSKPLTVYMRIKVETVNGLIDYQTDTVTRYSSARLKMSVTNATVKSTYHKYKISGTQVYSVTTQS